MLQELGELLEFCGVEVGGSAEIHSILLPEDQVVSADRPDFHEIGWFSFAGPDKHVDEMFLALVDERCDIAMIQIIEASADEREAFTREIRDRRSEVEFAVEPRLHGVLVRGFDVIQMSRLKRADMVRDDLFS